METIIMEILELLKVTAFKTSSFFTREYNEVIRRIREPLYPFLCHLHIIFGIMLCGESDSTADSLSSHIHTYCPKANSSRA